MSVAVSTLRYGEDEAQEGELYLPDVARPPVVCLLHGGFWRMPYGREQFDAVARDLAERGLAVWNLGYRRVGAPGGGFPGTLLDVDAGLDRMHDLADQIDLARILVAGHSAGGQLALWSAARKRANIAGVKARVQPIAVAGLAPLCDLASAAERRLGGGAVEAFLGEPAEFASRVASASPVALLPLDVQQLILHGAEDEAVPISMSRTYAEAASAAGDAVELIELPRTGHMDFLDPQSEASARFRSWLEDVLLSRS